MSKFSKIFLLGSLVGNTLGALEFGSMGNVSASMGGAGVALKNSHWALYYNPALLGVDKKSRFAYSFGASIKEKNLLSLANINYSNLSEFPSSKGTFGGAIAGAVPSKSLGVDGAFGDVLKNVKFGSVTGITNATDIQNFMADILSSSGAGTAEVNKVKNATTLEEASKNFNSAVMSGDSLNANGVKAFGDLKGSLLNAIDTTGGDTALIKGIVENLEPTQLGGFTDLLAKSGSGSNISLNDFLQSVGGIHLSQGSNPQMNRFIQDVNTITDALKQNSFDFSTQNGMVFQFGGLGADDRGAIAVGIFGSAFGSANANFDPTHNQVILKSDTNYIAVNVDNNSIGLSSSNQADFDNHSIMSENANHQIHANGLILGEIPIGYGQAFSTAIGDFSVGFALKYIFGMGYSINQTGSFDTIKDGFKGMSFNKAPKDQTFGIDLGFLYDYKGFTLGLVGKDLNVPSIKINGNNKITLDPQVRLGAAYQWKMISLALDADLTPNRTLSYFSPKSQMIGGGVNFDFKYIDFRFGSMYDFRSFNNEGLILTGGINILGFLDVAVQSSLKTTTIDTHKVPNYISIKLGGGFSW